MRDTRDPIFNNEMTSFNSPTSNPPLSNNTKKELLVFAVYINVGTQSAHKARQTFGEMRQTIRETFKDVESQTNYLIKFLFFPVKEQETKIVCVFPKSEISPISKELLDDIKDVIGQEGEDIETLLEGEDNMEEEDVDWYEDKTKEVDEVQKWKKDFLNDFTHRLNE